MQIVKLIAGSIAVAVVGYGLILFITVTGVLFYG